jgi:phosphoribosyl 1,2-cyclic phosphodiesterase
VRVTYWGTRGSIPVPGEAMDRYGGNTSCVEVTLSDGSELILDAGTGIRRLGREREPPESVHLLLTHLHLDHIQGLMFFAPLFDPRCEVVVWGPPWFETPLIVRLGRYISAPLAPVEIRELPARVSFEACPSGAWEIGSARVEAAFVNHRGPTFGYRITDGDTVLTYIPDHEPALGQDLDRSHPDWISGLELARDADLLIHDAQYLDAEYPRYVGWGHCALGDTLTFARRAGVRGLALFHHDPLRDDEQLDSVAAEAGERGAAFLESVYVAAESQTVELGHR